jgi:hypothetical protein
VKVAKGKGEPLARFLKSLLIFGAVADKRAANGGVMACEKKGAENNLNEAGRRVIASHYRGAARLAGFMPGWGVGLNHDRCA